MEQNTDQADFIHKMLFFFMPEKLTFLNLNKNDNDDIKHLKTITPYFYWCSAHEFKNIKSSNKFLFQYQIYSIEGNEMLPGEVIQKWFENKNNIKIEIMNFIDIWLDHQRLIINPERQDEQKSKNFISIPVDNIENMQYFSHFANFVAKSIINLQSLYINESEGKKFDIQQKRFWENTAMHYKKLLDNQQKPNPKEKQSKPKKQKKIKDK